MAEAKTERLNFRVTAQDEDLLRRAATEQRETLSEFIVESGRERAQRVLADRARFVLDDKQWAAFNAALDRPPEASSTVVELLQRSRPGD